MPLKLPARFSLSFGSQNAARASRSRRVDSKETKGGCGVRRYIRSLTFTPRGISIIGIKKGGSELWLREMRRKLFVFYFLRLAFPLPSCWERRGSRQIRMEMIGIVYRIWGSSRIPSDFRITGILHDFALPRGSQRRVLDGNRETCYPAIPSCLFSSWISWFIEEGLNFTYFRGTNVS